MNKLIAAGLLAALSSAALAGGSVAPAAAPIAVTAVAAVPAVTWAGGYAGASLGYGDLSLEADLEDLVEDFLPGFDIDELPSLSLSDGASPVRPSRLQLAERPHRVPAWRRPSSAARRNSRPRARA